MTKPLDVTVAVRPKCLRRGGKLIRSRPGPGERPTG